MPTRPKGSLDDLTVPKGGQAPAPAEPVRPQAPTTTSKAYAHTLSLRLTAEQYRRLRRFVAAHEDAILLDPELYRGARDPPGHHRDGAGRVS